MNWHMGGQYIEACSCKMLCPCIFGPAEPDRGWCAGAIAFDIQQGQANGTMLNGRKVVWVFNLPKDFASGNGTARLYIDDGASTDQRVGLERIFSGKEGGPTGIISTLITTWLPTKTAPIVFAGDDPLRITVGEFGRVELQRIRDDKGRQTMLLRAPIHEVFQVESEDLARSDGTRWSDPEMRDWESGGSGGIGAFSWSVG